jgi:parvulin-like peptidyl-prolyl isomerase
LSTPLPILLPGPLSAFQAHPAALRQLADLGVLPSVLGTALTAEAVSAIAIDQDEQRDAVARYCQAHRIADQDALQAHLEQRGVRFAAFLWELTLPLRIQRHALAAYGAKAEARFLERKAHLDQVVYTLIRVQDPGLARELYLRVDNGEATMADLASEFSQGPEQKSQGLVGPVPLKQAHPKLFDQLRTHPPGNLIPPFQIEDWWLVVRVEQMVPAVFDDTMASTMAQELFNISIQQDVARIMQALLRINDTPAIA